MVGVWWMCRSPKLDWHKIASFCDEKHIFLKSQMNLSRHLRPELPPRADGSPLTKWHGILVVVPVWRKRATLLKDDHHRMKSEGELAHRIHCLNGLGLKRRRWAPRLVGKLRSQNLLLSKSTIWVPQSDPLLALP